MTLPAEDPESASRLSRVRCGSPDSRWARMSLISVQVSAASYVPRLAAPCRVMENGGLSVETEGESARARAGAIATTTLVTRTTAAAADVRMDMEPPPVRDVLLQGTSTVKCERRAQVPGGGDAAAPAQIRVIPIASGMSSALMARTRAGRSTRRASAAATKFKSAAATKTPDHPERALM